MAVPRQDPRLLWALPPADFNHWRATHELPALFLFLQSKLPRFDGWMKEHRLNVGECCRFVPTGLLFSGTGKRLFVEEAAPGENHRFFWPCPSKEARIKWAQDHGERVPDFREVEPYFGWANRVLKRDRYFREDDANPTRTDSFVFGGWRVEHGISSAYLFRTFELLKLGGTTVGTGSQMGRRNLDLADLDDLQITGLPSNYATTIHYSTLRRVAVRDALLHHVTFHACEMAGFTVVDSELQIITLTGCSAQGIRTRGPRIADSMRIPRDREQGFHGMVNTDSTAT